jgi:hypothetical protein
MERKDVQFGKYLLEWQRNLLPAHIGCKILTLLPWDVTQCSLVKMDLRFGRTRFLCPYGRTVIWWDFLHGRCKQEVVRNTVPNCTVSQNIHYQKNLVSHLRQSGCHFSALLSYTRWFKYDRDKRWLVYTQIVPVIFEPPCIFTHHQTIGDSKWRAFQLQKVIQSGLAFRQDEAQ